MREGGILLGLVESFDVWAGQRKYVSERDHRSYRASVESAAHLNA